MPRTVHELSLCRALIRQVEEIARRKHAQAVTAIYLRMGPLSGIESQSLRQAYPLASAGSIAESAALHIEQSPLKVRCETCGAESTASPERLVCGACGDTHTQLLSGNELLITKIDVSL